MIRTQVNWVKENHLLKRRLTSLSTSTNRAPDVKPVFTSLVTYQEDGCFAISLSWKIKSKNVQLQRNTHTLYFFWHLPSITFVNGFPCVYMFVNKGIRPKIKQNEANTQRHMHTCHISRFQARFGYFVSICHETFSQQPFTECLQWVRHWASN